MREPTPYTPVWIMRAGRAATCRSTTRRARKAGSFLALAKTPGARLRGDAAAARAASRSMRRSSSPTSSRCPMRWAWGCISSRAKARNSSARCATTPTSRDSACPDMESLALRVRRGRAHRAASSHGRVPLIGFSGSPFTLACYMIEGGGSDDFRLVKIDARMRAPTCCISILDSQCAPRSTAYLNAQIAAGAQARHDLRHLGRHALGRCAFAAFSLAYSRRVIAALTRTNEGRTVPRDPLHQGRRAVARVAMAECGRRCARHRLADATSARARRRVGDRVALQGNLDPMALFGTARGDRERGRARLGVTWTPVRGTSSTSATASRSTRRPEHVHALVEAVHSRSVGAHAARSLSRK